MELASEQSVSNDCDSNVTAANIKNSAKQQHRLHVLTNKMWNPCAYELFAN